MDEPLVIGESQSAHERLSQEIGMTLCRKYPGYAWGVEIQPPRVLIHCADVQSALMTNESYCYVLKLSNALTDTNFPATITRIGGELLERANLNRGRNKFQEVKRVDGVEAAHQPVDFERQPLIIMPEEI